MLILLSPAKSLDEGPAIDGRGASMPRLLGDSSKLAAQLKKMSVEELQSLMSVSDKLAELNAERYQCWEADYSPDRARQALWCFTGDVYQGIALDEWGESHCQRAESMIRILSGLYGVLRPHDLILPYRLEMGTRMKTSRGKNLYEFWGEKLTELLNEDIEAAGHDWVCNLASNEYFSAVQPEKLTKPLISPVFKDEKNGKFKIISFYAKKARGMMADFIVRENVRDPQGLESFTVGGYRFSQEESEEGKPVFLRPEKVTA